MKIRPQIIYGEAFEDLVPGLLALADGMTVDADGMWRVSIALQPKDGVPLQRALMRAEAELMREDAESIGCERYEARTYEQRACDALIRLAQAIGAYVPDSAKRARRDSNPQPSDP